LVYIHQEQKTGSTRCPRFLLYIRQKQQVTSIYVTAGKLIVLYVSYIFGGDELELL
jgi:predicted nucleic acid-binding Zn ribbon protein